MGTLSHFSTSIVTKHHKIGATIWGKTLFQKKVSQCQKKSERADPLVSPGTVCYAEKQEKLFWFSSLGQMIQFGTIKFCRTLEEPFWSVRVD